MSQLEQKKRFLRRGQLKQKTQSYCEIALRQPNSKWNQLDRVQSNIFGVQRIRRPKIESVELLKNKCKWALLIGCEYTQYARTGRAQRLPGCHNDIYNMYHLLVNKYGYDTRCVFVLADDGKHTLPTRQGIIKAMENLIRDVSAIDPNVGVDNILLYYSGHGSHIPDRNGDEILTNQDQILVPCDYLDDTNALTDDYLSELLVKRVPNHVKQLLAVFDCCFSGTILDLSWIWQPQSRKLIPAHKLSTSATALALSPLTQNSTPEDTKNASVSVNNPLIICLSGCNDQQTSASVSNLPGTKGQWQGVLSWGLRQLLHSTKYQNQILNWSQAAVQLNTIVQPYSSQKPQLTINQYKLPSTLSICL
jgi:hypothetical protein